MGISADFFSKLIIHHDAEQQFVHTMLDDFAIPKGPNTQFWFGADDAGRDLFIRVLYGVRVSLFIAVVATGMQVVIGVTLGVLAGFLRGWVDSLVSRLVELILCIPFLLLAMDLSVVTGGGLTIVIVILSFFGWPYLARVVRSIVLSQRESDFIEAAYRLVARRHGSCFTRFSRTSSDQQLLLPLSSFP
jgi:peptide/nickel transport system permease protein